MEVEDGDIEDGVVIQDMVGDGGGDGGHGIGTKKIKLINNDIFFL